MEPDISYAAGLLAEPARAAIVTVLLDGRALPAGELARSASISAQTASNHLSKLLEAEFLAVEVEGRHRYYRLSNAEVATAVEALACLSKTKICNSPKPVTESAVCYLRHCYSHMAGQVAVRVTDQLLQRRVLLFRSPKQFSITNAGNLWLAELGISTSALRPRNGLLAKACLDWTERRHHIGGPLGVALFSTFLERKWIIRSKQSRALRITPAGAYQFEEHFGIRVPQSVAG